MLRWRRPRGSTPREAAVILAANGPPCSDRARPGGRGFALPDRVIPSADASAP